VVGGEAAVRLDPRPQRRRGGRRGLERRSKASLGALPLAPPLVNGAELVLDSREPGPLASSCGQLVGGERAPVVAEERPELADALLQLRRLSLIQSERSLQVGERVCPAG
jgi:hypothetical protein